jgi:hypothetical protein
LRFKWGKGKIYKHGGSRDCLLGDLKFAQFP